MGFEHLNGSQPQAIFSAARITARNDPHVRAAFAQIAGECLLDLLFSRSFGRRKERGRLHDHAVDAVAALRGLFINERLLQWVRLIRSTEAFERDDFGAGHGGNRHHATTQCFAVVVDRARATLCESASEMKPVQTELVAQRVQQRHVRVVGMQLAWSCR